MHKAISTEGICRAILSPISLSLTVRSASYSLVLRFEQTWLDKLVWFEPYELIMIIIISAWNHTLTDVGLPFFEPHVSILYALIRAEKYTNLKSLLRNAFSNKMTDITNRY